MDGDINPDFKFDLQDPYQAPWEFDGTLDEEKSLGGKSQQSTIDQKIRNQLANKKEKKQKKQQKQRPASKRRSEQLSGSDSEEDTPLQQELDDSDSDASEGDQLSNADASEEDSTDTEDRIESDLYDAAMDVDESDDGEEADSDPDDADDNEGDSELDDNDKGSDISGSGSEADGTRPGKMNGVSSVKGKNRSETVNQVEARRASHKEASTSNGLYAKMPDGTKFSAASFAEMKLSRPLLKACAELGYKTPTPIQAACIPLALAGRDILGSAMTGSGKTAAFSLPMLEKLIHRNRRVAATYALVLVPTRELAVQVHSMMQKLGQYTDVRIALVVGGLSLQVQAVTLKSSPEIIVATPGRLIDHLRNSESVGLEDLQLLVLDEADRLLELGFSEEIAELLRLTPRNRQTMLYSATMTEEVNKLALLSLKSPVRLSADPKAMAPHQLVQEIVRIRDKDKAVKEAILLALCSRGFQTGRAIVFFRTKKQAHRAKILFGLAEIASAAELHGDMSQSARLESLDSFRKGEVAFLLATDVAARGLDILGLENVINFDAPSSLASYLHRIGRTARAGNKGRSVTFVDDEDRRLVKDIMKQKIKLQERVVPPPLIKKWSTKIEQLGPGIEALAYEEREERQLRRAEMEVTKAENMIEHESEIYARPARTWFQTEKEKKAAAQKSTEPEKAGNKKERDEKRNAEKRKRGDDVSGAGKKAKLMQETLAASKTIRAIKAKQTQLRQQGLPTVKAGKAAAQAITGKSMANSKKKTKSAKSETGPKSSPAKVYAGGKSSGKFKPPSKTKQDKKKLKTGGKSSKSFKSKKRHKRK